MRSAFLSFFILSTFSTFAQSNANISVYVDRLWMGKGGVVPYVAGLFPNSAASKAGLKLGDIILSINGKMEPYADANEIAEMMYGKPGTPVTLEIKRFGVKKKITVTRSIPPRNGYGMVFQKFPALDSIRHVSLYQLYYEIGMCVVGNCENGIGMKMQDSVLLYANFGLEDERTTYQLRAKDRYEETEYLNNRRDGKRYVWFDNGTIFRMMYKDGKVHGQVTETTSNGGVYESTFEEGVKISERVVKKPGS